MVCKLNDNEKLININPSFELYFQVLFVGLLTSSFKSF